MPLCRVRVRQGMVSLVNSTLAGIGEPIVWLALGSPASGWHQGGHGGGFVIGPLKNHFSKTCQILSMEIYLND